MKQDMKRIEAYNREQLRKTSDGAWTDSLFNLESSELNTERWGKMSFGKT